MEICFCLDDFSYSSLLSTIKNTVDSAKYNFEIPTLDRTVLRIALLSLGTASWSGDLVTFLIQLRKLVQSFCATCLITIPAHLFEVRIIHVLAGYRQFVRVHETQKTCECDTCVPVNSYFLCCFIRQISRVLHLEPSRGRSGNYA